MKGEIVKGLLYKDFKLARNAIIAVGIMQLIVSALMIVFSVMTKNGMGLYTPLLKCLSCYLVFYFAALANNDMFCKDERSVWRNFVISTPKTGRGQVRSKYIVIFTIEVCILVVSVITNLICNVIEKDKGLSVYLLFVLFFSIHIFKQATELPFVFRFGNDIGIKVKGFFTALIIMCIALYGLYGDISMFLKDDFLNALMRFLDSHDVKWFISVFGVVSGISYLLSYFISVKLYRRS